MTLAMAHETHNLPWRTAKRGANVARSAKHYMLMQVESGSCCPITMTYACVPAIKRQPEVFAEWEPLLQRTSYDPRMVPAGVKGGVLIGMAMTEKQGGSDVRSNTARAVAVDSGGPGAAYFLDGHKWFCSAPMCDAFLTLANTDNGLSCFIVPRWKPDGTRNPFLIQRLKDKLGNRSNASAEVEYRATWSRMVGEEGRGVRTIIDMVHRTRLDCVGGSAGLMRQAVAQAANHIDYRSAFGRRLVEQPLMRNVLADLCVEAEAAMATMARLARSYDEAADDAAQAAFARIATAVAKYWVCKRTPHAVYEAMECLGGNGYVEESIMPRLYREAPVNAIWEGSGNVICLDVIRAMVREPESVDAFLDEVRAAKGGDSNLDKLIEDLERDLSSPPDEASARRVVERMAIALQASLMVRHAPAAVADAFCAGRVAGGYGLAFGCLPSTTPFEDIIDRHSPLHG
jgi:putative acyl-CoA dehydrogenase